MVRAQFVFFDASDTLLRPRPSFTDYCIEFLEKKGIAIDVTLIEKAKAVANLVYNTHKIFLPRLYADLLAEKAVWAHYFAELLRCLANLEQNDMNWLQYGYEVNNYFDKPENWILYDGVVSVLDNFHVKGIPMGIISDFGPMLPNHLRIHCIDSYFQIMLVSSLSGLCKSDGTIMYESAAKLAKTNTSGCVMVGDSYSSDIVPAKQAGFKTIWLNRYQDVVEVSTQDADEIVSDLMEVIDIVFTDKPL